MMVIILILVKIAGHCWSDDHFSVFTLKRVVYSNSMLKLRIVHFNFDFWWDNHWDIVVRRGENSRLRFCYEIFLGDVLSNDIGREVISYRALTKYMTKTLIRTIRFSSSLLHQKNICRFRKVRRISLKKILVESMQLLCDVSDRFAVKICLIVYKWLMKWEFVWHIVYYVWIDDVSFHFS